MFLPLKTIPRVFQFCLALSIKLQMNTFCFVISDYYYYIHRYPGHCNYHKEHVEAGNPDTFFSWEYSYIVHCL